MNIYVAVLTLMIVSTLIMAGIRLYIFTHYKKRKAYRLADKVTRNIMTAASVISIGLVLAHCGLCEPSEAIETYEIIAYEDGDYVKTDSYDGAVTVYYANENGRKTSKDVTNRVYYDNNGPRVEKNIMKWGWFTSVDYVVFLDEK